MPGIVRFGDCAVDIERYEIVRNGEPVHVEPQVFDVISYLIDHRDRVVTKEELLDTIWGDRFVSESTLSTRINAARKALGDDGSTQAIIKTVFGRGFQFIAELSEESPRSDPNPDLPRDRLRFATTADGAQLAYAVTGTGPVLVKAANWMTHLEFDHESPVWRPPPPRPGQWAGSRRRLSERSPGPGGHRGGQAGGGARSRTRPRRLGHRGLAISPGVRQPVHARRHTGTVGPVHCAPGEDDLPGERRPVPRDLRPHRHHRPRPQGHLPEPLASLS